MACSIWPVWAGSMMKSRMRPVVTITSQTAALYPLFVRTRRCPMMPLSVPAIMVRTWFRSCGGKRSIRRFYGLGSVQGVERGEDHLGAFGVPDLPYEYHVGVLPQHAPQGPRKGGRIRTHLALVYDALVVSMNELDRVFDGDHVLGDGMIDHVYHRGERRRLAAACGACDQDDTALLEGERADHLGQTQRLEFRDLEGHVTHRYRDRASLPEGVDPEPAILRLVGEVRLSDPLELLDQGLGDDLGEERFGVREVQHAISLHGGQQTLNPRNGRRANLEVQVTAPLSNQQPDKIFQLTVPLHLLFRPFQRWGRKSPNTTFLPSILTGRLNGQASPSDN